MHDDDENRRDAELQKIIKGGLHLPVSFCAGSFRNCGTEFYGAKL